MRKRFILLALTLIGVNGFSQEKNETTDFKKNELKINGLFMIIGSFDVAYERILNEESAAGIAIEIPFDKDNFDLKFSATPYYRYYFGKKPASGFFGEAFGSFNIINDYVYFEDDFNYTEENKTLTDFALGLGLGGKWVTKKGLIFELNAGIGRNLFNGKYERDYEIIGRGGITVGYRF